MPETNKQKRILKGKAVSDAMTKTVVVSVATVKKHSLYGKFYTVTKKYKVHDEENELKKGDEVMFQETRPLSKEKRWKVIKKEQKG